MYTLSRNVGKMKASVTSVPGLQKTTACWCSLATAKKTLSAISALSSDVKYTKNPGKSPTCKVGDSVTYEVTGRQGVFFQNKVKIFHLNREKWNTPKSQQHFVCFSPCGVSVHFPSWSWIHEFKYSSCLTSTHSSAYRHMELCPALKNNFNTVL